MRAAWRRPALTEALAALAMVLAVAGVVATLVLHTVQPEVDPIAQLSWAYANGEQGWLVDAVIVSRVMSLLALGAAVALRVARSTSLWACVGLTVISGGATAAGGAGSAAAAASTDVATLVGVGAVALAAVALGWLGLRDGEHATASRGVLAIAAAGLVAAAAFVVLTRSGDLAGAAERGFLAMSALWVLVVGSQIRSTTTTRTSTERDGRLAVA